MTAAIYSRISKDPLEEGAGVDRQERDCRKLLARQGFPDPVIYRDNHRGAWQRNRSRPAWDELLAAVRAGAITTLAVWHPDRLMRQPRDLEELLDAADRGGLRLVSAGGGRDLANPDDRFILRVEIAAACKSSDDSSRRITRALEDRAAAGLSHGGPRPFGLSEDRLGLDQAEATAIRTAAGQLLDGQSLRSVCKALNATGLTPTGKATTWSPATVRQMLQRPSIAGLQTHRGQVAGRTAFPAVLDEATWRAVGLVLTDPARRITRSSAYAHLLTGLLYCGRCETRMRVVLRKSGGRQYACAGCFRCAAAEQAVDDVVSGAVTERLATSTLPRPSGGNADLLAQLGAARGRLEEATREFTDDPDVSPAQLRIVTRRLRARIGDLERQCAAAALATVRPAAGEDWTVQPLERRRAVVAAVVEEIVLAPAGGRAYRFDPKRLTVSWRSVAEASDPPDVSPAPAAGA